MNLSKHRKMAVAAAGLILLGAAFVFAFSGTSAPVEAGQTPPVGADYAGMLLKMVVSVILVCLLAYGVLRWGLGRLNPGGASADHMEVLGRLGVGPDRTIMVVRVGSRFLVVGQSETGISMLTELSDDEAYDFVAAKVTED